MISGVGEPTRAAVTAAASEAGMPLGQWVEQALTKALAEGLEPGVSLEEIEARRRQAVADAVQPVQETIARIELATAPSSPGGRLSIRRLRQRLRQRQGW